MPESPAFVQHPDTLIKKADRGAAAPATTEPVLDPAVEAAEQASFDDLKKKLPNLLFGDKPKEDKPAAPAKPAESAAPAAPATPAEPAEKKVKVVKQPDPAEAARTAVAEAAKAIADKFQPPAPAAPAAEPAKANVPPPHFSEEDKENYELFKVLSESEPGKYKDKHTQYANFVDKFSSYKRRWEKDHPGESFDKDADEHEEFYTKNQPEYTEADLDKARIRLETSREVERRLAVQKKDYEDRLREIEDKTVGAEVGREASKVADGATGTFVHQLGDEAIKTALAKGPDALKEADPLAYEVLNEEVADLQQHVVELHNIVNRKSYFNPNNPRHATIAAFVGGQERAIKQLPPAQQIYEGRQFVTRADYAALPAAQRDGYWTLTEPDVVHMLSSASAARAAKRLSVERERIKTLAPKYGFVAGAPASPATPAATPAAPAAAAPASNKPQSPSGSAGEAAAPLGAPAKKGDDSTEKKLVNLLF